VGTLATAVTENSRSDFWAIVMVVVGTWVSGSVAGGVVEEEEVRDLFFLRSASRSGNEVIRQVETTHTLSCFHPQQKENKQN